jgi:hypothetical protein
LSGRRYVDLKTSLSIGQLLFLVTTLCEDVGQLEPGFPATG